MHVNDTLFVLLLNEDCVKFEITLFFYSVIIG
jgi:hypothetical protein